MKKAIVLLSSGLDSTVNLCVAKRETNIIAVLTFDYGQRAAQKEIECSRKITNMFSLNHKVIDLPWLKDITCTSLVNREEVIPVGEDVKIDNYHSSMESKKAVWVPNRNGVFLNIAAAYADSLGADYIVPGFNKEEAATFPDNSTEYIQALNVSFSYSTQAKAEVKCFTDQLDKTEIVHLGREIEAPFELMWSCYFDGEKPCGECESCQRSIRAMKQ